MQIYINSYITRNMTGVITNYQLGCIIPSWPLPNPDWVCPSALTTLSHCAHHLLQPACMVGLWGWREAIWLEWSRRGASVS